jgi:hypothetical protein
MDGSGKADRALRGEPAAVVFTTDDTDQPGQEA